jgi:spore germination cell wall hydrolase CwlJ-like protein
MSPNGPICDAWAVNFARTVVAAVAAMSLAGWADAMDVPTIVLSEPPPISVGPQVTFAVPKYTLTPQERDLVASCLVLEAASQGEFGMRGVMAVVYNRSRGLPELFTPIVLQEKQFSAFNKMTAGRETAARLIARAQRDRMWETALAIVDEAAVQNTWRDPTGGATHYTRVGERTRWTHTLAQTTIIGRHAFYR